MADSLDITQLMDWLEGRLSEDEAAAISAAIQADDSYKATVAWLQAFLNLSRSTVLIEPPPDLLQETISHFRAFAQGKRAPGWLQRLIATLTSDSWQRPVPAGVRRTGLGAAPRQLVYQANTVDIVLNIRAGSDEALFDLVGQVFPKDESDPASFTVQLTLRGRELEVALTYTDNVGKFAFTNLAAGAYMLIILGNQAEITIAEVALSA
jgi:hypothetical protein